MGWLSLESWQTNAGMMSFWRLFGNHFHANMLNNRVYEILLFHVGSDCHFAIRNGRRYLW